MPQTVLAPPVVARWGQADPSQPLVVLLHGRGATEQDIVGLAAQLPHGPEYVAVRAPLAEGAGYAWFANRGIGRPREESLRLTMDWFRAWLDEEATPERPVVLIGFSGGAAFGGGLVLDDPARFAGAAILCGTVPFDAGVPVVSGRLADVAVFVAQGESDVVIPRDLLESTWDYLLTQSGAQVVGLRFTGGHDLTREAVEALRAWLAELLVGVPS